MTVDPTTIDFGTVAIGTLTAPTRTITVANPSSLELSISKVELRVLSGAARPDSPPPFRWLGGTCHGGLTLPAGGSCTISTDFIPQVLGPAAAELLIVDNTLDSPQVVHLSGTGSPEVRPTPAPPAEQPQATLLRHPGKRTKSRNATFTFAGNSTTAGFVCRLDRRRFRACTSPIRYHSLKPGGHRFTVRAVAVNGVQTIGAGYGWRVLKKHALRRHRRHRH